MIRSSYACECEECFIKNKQDQDFPGSPVTDSNLLMQGSRVQSLVREIRSCMSHGTTNNPIIESQMSDEIIESQKVICLNLFTSKLFAVVLF